MASLMFDAYRISDTYKSPLYLSSVNCVFYIFLKYKDW